MRTCWCAVASLVMLGLVSPAFAQFGGPGGFGGGKGGGPLEGQLKKIEGELKKLQEQVASLKSEVANLKSPAKTDKGQEFKFKFKGEFDEKKLAEMKKFFEGNKGEMKKFFEGKEFGKGKGYGKGFGGFGPPGHMKHHGDEKSTASASGKSAAMSDHELLVQILQELKAIRKQK